MSLTISDGVDQSQVRYVAIAARDSAGIMRTTKGYRGTLVTISHSKAVARGIIPGAAPFSSNGRVVTTGAVVRQPVHSAGVVNIATAAGVQMSFVSTSANDAAAGSGLQTLSMGYIEAVTLLAKSETITMTGTTPVLSAAINILFINSLTQTANGTVLGCNAGDITATNGGLTYGTILAGMCVQESSYRMVPAGKVFYADEIIVSANSAVNQAAQTVFHIVGYSSSLPYWTPSNSIGCVDSSEVVPLSGGRGITAGSVIGIIADSDKASQLTASFIGTIEDA